MKMRYSGRSYIPDVASWPNPRCGSGQGAGSVYGCVLAPHDGGPHKWDDPKWEAIAEVYESITYTAECYRCSVELGSGFDVHKVSAVLAKHMKEVHVEVEVP